MDELMLVAATPFKRNNKNSLSIKDFEFVLSFDLKWMAPDVASKIRDRAIGSQLLKFQGAELIPNFDISNIEIPHGFKPSESIFKERSAIEDIIALIVANCGKSARDTTALINKKQEQLDDLVDIEVAGLLTARELGCDIDLIYDRIHNKVFSKQEMST
ncbi:DUF2240 family protein [Methanolobus profundi]|uniref:DUF2240 family protein n=1 Tax=Methanolobus profundi TaxID=487685 RepID=A0A1I4S544_9EURY|nr:DUF2240 family protein [Methanolobus profundi]SFM59632.1 hypothetical protein SAMN04488696_1782 [Methanolobus profundi]